jgi:hypothetical protein
MRTHICCLIIIILTNSCLYGQTNSKDFTNPETLNSYTSDLSSNTKNTLVHCPKQLDMETGKFF